MFTDYRPRVDANVLAFLPSDSANTSHTYRQYLISNATSLLEQQRNMPSCCDVSDMPGTMLPEQQISVCDTNSCTIRPNVEGGVGVGRATAAGVFPPVGTEVSGVSGTWKSQFLSL
jgi:hypothetical protein